MHSYCSTQFCPVQLLSHVRLLVTPWTAAGQALLSPTLKARSNSSCPLSRWCHLTISSSVVPFSSCPQSFPASRSFPWWVSLHIRWPKYWSFAYLLNEYSYSYYILAEYTKEVAALIYSYPCFSYPLYSCTILWLSGHLLLKTSWLLPLFWWLWKKTAVVNKAHMGFCV